MTPPSAGPRLTRVRHLRTAPLARVLSAALLGPAAAVLVACGSTGKSLIPAGDAGPLQRDFEAVARAAQAGNGDCTATEEALHQTEQDFAALPASIDRGLHERLRLGIGNLASRAHAICVGPSASSTLTTPSTSTSSSTTPSTTSTSTTSTSTSTTTSTPTTETNATSNTGGGTPAGGGTPGPGGPGVSGGAGEGNGREGRGHGEGNGQ
jgi:cell division septation protein DedD